MQASRPAWKCNFQQDRYLAESRAKVVGGDPIAVKNDNDGTLFAIANDEPEDLSIRCGL